MMNKKQTIILSISIPLFFLLGIVGLKFHNEIYVWTLGDVKSLYAQAESLYQQKEYEEARKLYAKLAGIDSASRCQYVLGDMYFQGQGESEGAVITHRPFPRFPLPRPRR